jgi:hypothetical protein
LPQLRFDSPDLEIESRRPGSGSAEERKMSTFVLRLAGPADARLCGTVRHVASGVSRPFADTAELLAFLREWSATAGLSAALQDPLLVPDPDEPRSNARSLDSRPDVPGLQ